MQSLLGDSDRVQGLQSRRGIRLCRFLNKQEVETDKLAAQVSLFFDNFGFDRGNRMVSN